MHYLLSYVNYIIIYLKYEYSYSRFNAIAAIDLLNSAVTKDCWYIKTHVRKYGADSVSHWWTYHLT